jgi:Tol biopolymer transport system component
MLTGTFQVVGAGAGDQVNPHVDCNLASYTNDTGGSAEIHYFDFNTSTDQAIPVVGVSFLSDVSGTRIVYTNVSFLGSRIGVYNTATSTSMFLPDGNQRTHPSIGGSTVAFEDRSFSSNPNESEIVVYNLGSGTTTRLTNDALMDTNPEVSPNGDLVVFQKCQTNGFGCDIYVSRQTSPGVWTTQPITGAASEDTNPQTNGTIVVYTSTRSEVFSLLITDVITQPLSLIHITQRTRLRCI